MSLVDSLPTTGWNGRDLSPVAASVGLEVRRLLGQTWEDVNGTPVMVPVTDGGMVRLPVFFNEITQVVGASGRPLAYEVAATCAGVPGFEQSPRILHVPGGALREQVAISGTHGMSANPTAVLESATAYGSILAGRMDRMGVKSKSLGSVNVSYTDGTGYSPEQEALQVTGSAILAYRLEPLTPSLSLSRAGWWGE